MPIVRIRGPTQEGGELFFLKFSQVLKVESKALKNQSIKNLFSQIEKCF